MSDGIASQDYRDGAAWGAHELGHRINEARSYGLDLSYGQIRDMAHEIQVLMGGNLETKHQGGRMTDLNDAVDQLTIGQTRKQPQDIVHTYDVEDTDGVTTQHQRVVGSQKVTITLPALLEQLDTAIRSSMGGSTPGAKLASEGSVLNVSALYEAMKIESQVGDWCRMAGVHRSKDTAKDLRAWHAAILSTNLNEEREAWYVTTLNSWAHTIRNLLDPWREMDLPDACPVCGAKSWWDKATGTEFLRPLIIKYRPEGADMVQQSRALCRACEQVWSVRELAYEIEQAEGNVSA